MVGACPTVVQEWASAGSAAVLRSGRAEVHARTGGRDLEQDIPDRDEQLGVVDARPEVGAAVGAGRGCTFSCLSGGRLHGLSRHVIGRSGYWLPFRLVRCASAPPLGERGNLHRVSSGSSGLLLRREGGLRFVAPTSSQAALRSVTIGDSWEIKGPREGLNPIWITMRRGRRPLSRS
jgi:hypothetical protein